MNKNSIVRLDKRRRCQQSCYCRLAGT